MANVVLVYATASKILRRAVFPDIDGDPSRWALPGEKVVVVDESSLTGDYRQDLATALGLTIDQIPTGRCAVVDRSGNVVAAQQLDPALDNIPGMTLISHEQAGPGWRWNAGTGFTGPPSPPPIRKPAQTPAKA